MSGVDPTWLPVGGMLVGALMGTVLTVLVLRAQSGRWRCRGCVHPYTVHITPAGAPAPCGQGLGLVCGCRVYLGKRPPARLLRVVEAEEEPALAPPPAATP